MRLEIQDQENVKNTYYRAPKVIPNIKKESDEYITIYNEEESVDLIVYQPHSKINEILEKAKKENIKVMSLGIFNKMIMS